MTEPLENAYFNWLCAKVLDTHTQNYYKLALLLHHIEFVWVVPFDRNRAEDGIELRVDFLRETGSESSRLWEDESCSILELLIAFANRASFQTEWSVRRWFNEMLVNLRLDQFRRVSDSDLPYIEEVIGIFMWRTYDPSGEGGLFPLSRTAHDQREVELWYQFNEYLDDKDIP